MFSLSGKISDFIRGGKLPKDVHVTGSMRGHGETPPSPKSIRSARGQGLGKGAQRRRNGGAS